LPAGLPEATTIPIWDVLLDEADRETFSRQLQKRKQGHNDDSRHRPQRHLTARSCNRHVSPGRL